jgi:hypothetical protein
MHFRTLIACAALVLACEPLEPVVIVVQVPAAPAASETFAYADPVAMKRNACEDIVRACAAGGYYVGGMNVGRGVIFNCLGPLKHGDPVARVSIMPATLHACFGANLDDAEGERIAMDRAAVLAPPPMEEHLPRRR